MSKLESPGTIKLSACALYKRKMHFQELKQHKHRSVENCMQLDPFLTQICCFLFLFQY